MTNDILELIRTALDAKDAQIKLLRAKLEYAEQRVARLEEECSAVKNQRDMFETMCGKAIDRLNDISE